MIAAMPGHHIASSEPAVNATRFSMPPSRYTSAHTPHERPKATAMKIPMLRHSNAEIGRACVGCGAEGRLVALCGSLAL